MTLSKYCFKIPAVIIFPCPKTCVKSSAAPSKHINDPAAILQTAGCGECRLPQVSTRRSKQSTTKTTPGTARKPVKQSNLKNLSNSTLSLEFFVCTRIPSVAVGLFRLVYRGCCGCGWCELIEVIVARKDRIVIHTIKLSATRPRPQQTFGKSLTGLRLTTNVGGGGGNLSIYVF